MRAGGEAVAGERAWARGENGYAVGIEDRPEGWTVVIRDPGGRVVHERACRDGSEARLFASTVRQHIYWLSAERFRAYYGLPEV